MKISDTKLWKYCIIGDIDSFEELYYRYYPVLFNYGMKLIRDKETVKDCIHDLFVKMICNYNSLSPTEHLKGYLLRSFRNKLFDLLEKQRIIEDISDHENEFVADDLFISLFGEEYISDDDTEKLKQILKTLSSRQQEILYLYYLNGLNHEEIAIVLGINYQSSKNLLFRTLTKIRSLYKNNIP